jgi:hypothetical protein
MLFGLWKKQRWPLVAALVVLYLSSIPLVGSRLIGWVESRHPAVPVAQVEPADVIVVLGGILGPKVEAGASRPISWILPSGLMRACSCSRRARPARLSSLARACPGGTRRRPRAMN